MVGGQTGAGGWGLHAGRDRRHHDMEMGSSHGGSMCVGVPGGRALSALPPAPATSPPPSFTTQRSLHTRRACFSPHATQFSVPASQSQHLSLRPPVSAAHLHEVVLLLPRVHRLDQLLGVAQPVGHRYVHSQLLQGTPGRRHRSRCHRGQSARSLGEGLPSPSPDVLVTSCPLAGPALPHLSVVQRRIGVGGDGDAGLLHPVQPPDLGELQPRHLLSGHHVVHRPAGRQAGRQAGSRGGCRADEGELSRGSEWS